MYEQVFDPVADSLALTSCSRRCRLLWWMVP